MKLTAINFLNFTNNQCQEYVYYADCLESLYQKTGLNEIDNILGFEIEISLTCSKASLFRKHICS